MEKHNGMGVKSGRFPMCLQWFPFARLCPAMLNLGEGDEDVWKGIRSDVIKRNGYKDGEGQEPGLQSFWTTRLTVESPGHCFRNTVFPT